MMKRQVKFRGKPAWVKGAPFVYGSLVVLEDAAYIFTTSIYPQHQVKPETVGEFTGHRDRRGASIYEHDIVRLEVVFCDDYEGIDEHVIHTGVVTYVPSKGWHIRVVKTWDVHEQKWRELSPAIKGIVQRRTTVVGDVFTNPELIES